MSQGCDSSRGANVSVSAISPATLTVVQAKKVAAALEQHFFLRRELRKTVPAALLHHLRLFRRPHTGEGQWNETSHYTSTHSAITHYVKHGHTVVLELNRQ